MTGPDYIRSFIHHSYLNVEREGLTQKRNPSYMVHVIVAAELDSKAPDGQVTAWTVESDTTDRH